MRGCFSAMHLDFHVHARPEPVDDRHEAVHGEPPQSLLMETHMQPLTALNGDAREPQVESFPVDLEEDELAPSHTPKRLLNAV